MARATIDVGSIFSVGTTVGAYPVASKRSGIPAGAGAVETAVVAANGLLTFDELTSAGPVWTAAAQVNSVWRYVDFTALADTDDIVFESSLPINVTDDDYGADSTGVADATAEIQAAINTASAAYVATGARRTVDVPAGTFLVDFDTAVQPIGRNEVVAALSIKSGVTLQGEPGRTTIKTAPVPNTTTTGSNTLSAATINVTATADFPTSGELQFEDVNDIVAYTGKTATTFTGCTGGASTVPAGTAVVRRRETACVAACHATEEVHDWSVRDILFDGQMELGVEIAHMAVFTGAAHDFEVTGCEFTHWLGKALHVLGENNGGSSRVPKRWRFNNNHVHDCSSNIVGWSGGGSYDFECSNNFIHDNQSLGAESFISLTQTSVARGKILNNRILDWGTIDIGGDDIEVAGNTIVPQASNTGAGIVVQLGSRVRVHHNDIDMSATASVNCHGIKLSESALTRVAVEHNDIKRGAATGITTFLGAGTHSVLSVSHNTVTSGSGSDAALNIATADRVRVIGNDVSGSTTFGLNLTSTVTDAVVQGNMLDGCQAIVSAPRIVVSGNRIVASAGLDALRLAAANGAVVTGNALYGGSNGSAGVLQISSNASDCRIVGNLIEISNASYRWLTEESGSDRNLISDNTFLGTTGTVSLSGSSSKLRRNSGYVTENGGSASKQNAATIAHGLSTTPTRATVTAATAKHIAAVTAVDGTNLTIALHDDAGAAIASNETVYWGAEV